MNELKAAFGAIFIIVLILSIVLSPPFPCKFEKKERNIRYECN